jgi:hypothetical protein
MRALGPAEILDAWERGRDVRPVERALALLGAAFPARSRDELAALPLGERDALLVALRGASFGDDLRALADCAACGEPLEVALRCADLPPARGDGGAPACEVEARGFRVRARPVTSADVAAIASETGVDAARRALLARCVLEARRGEDAVAAGDLPPEVEATVARALADADPGAEIALEVRCPACGDTSRAFLDAGAILWSEVAVRAGWILHEVHLLASAYGWREADILAMSAARRAAYVERVSG